MDGLIFLQSLLPPKAITVKRKILSAVLCFYSGVAREKEAEQEFVEEECKKWRRLAIECGNEGRIDEHRRFTGYSSKIVEIRARLASAFANKTNLTLAMELQGKV